MVVSDFVLSTDASECLPPENNSESEKGTQLTFPPSDTEIPSAQSLEDNNLPFWMVSYTPSERTLPCGAHGSVLTMAQHIDRYFPLWSLHWAPVSYLRRFVRYCLSPLPCCLDASGSNTLSEPQFSLLVALHRVCNISIATEQGAKHIGLHGASCLWCIHLQQVVTFCTFFL